MINCKIAISAKDGLWAALSSQDADTGIEKVRLDGDEAMMPLLDVISGHVAVVEAKLRARHEDSTNILD